MRFVEKFYAKRITINGLRPGMRKEKGYAPFDAPPWMQLIENKTSELACVPTSKAASKRMLPGARARFGQRSRAAVFQEDSRSWFECSAGGENYLQFVSNKSGRFRCCSEDVRQHAGADYEELASNRAVLLRSKGLVVNDRGKGIGKMSGKNRGDERCMSECLLFRPLRGRTHGLHEFCYVPRRSCQT